jgi:UDP-N-acetylglucosamine 2-epimerase (non-hydrolysing)
MTNIAPQKCKILICIGTRPEAVKMSAFINLARHDPFFQCYVCATGQHVELFNDVASELKIHTDYNLNIMRKNQSLEYVLSEVVNKVSSMISIIKPKYVLVHGDTTTCLGSSLAAFYCGVKTLYIEAGWRSNNSQYSFPEEMHRILATKLATYYFCTNQHNFETLIEEKIPSEKIHIIGNPIEDVLRTTVCNNYIFQNSRINEVLNLKKYIIPVTFHRRENRGKIRDLVTALKNILLSEQTLSFVWIYHPNYSEDILDYLKTAQTENFIIFPPLSITDTHNLLYRASVVITDSGGIQEETSIMDIPTIILREINERQSLLGKIHVVSSIAEQDIKAKIFDLIALKNKPKSVCKIGENNNVSKKLLSIIKNKLEF